MDRIGLILREARERQGISYDQVEQVIMIKKRYLEAMENEQWSKLPGKVYAKGFLRSYARFLKLNEQAIVDLYEVEAKPEAETEVATIEKDETAPLEPRRKIELNNKPKKKVIIVFCIISLILLFGAQWGVKYFNELSPGNIDNNLSDELTDSEIDTNIPGIPPNNETTPVEPELPAKNTIDVVISAQEAACWIRLRDGEVEVYEGTLNPGDKVEFNDLKQLNIKAGNAGAIQVSINGENIEPLGDINQVVTKTFVVDNNIIQTIE